MKDDIPRLKGRRAIFGGGILMLGMLAGWYYGIYQKPGLRIEWEGIVGDYNYRDLGHSLNECLQARGFSKRFYTQVLMRSNKWFSGWNCRNVGAPDLIYTLNFEPDKGYIYFCQRDDGTEIKGRHYFPAQTLNNIEFESFWREHKGKNALCRQIRDVLKDVALGKRVLFHCEAGRDRAGAFAALLSAGLAEVAGMRMEEMIAAIECDYRKSSSLASHKYGRMDSFVNGMMDSGGVAYFLKSRCDVELDLLLRASTQFLYPQVANRK